MTVHDPDNLGTHQIEVFALSGQLFQWMVINHAQQREGHLLIVAQGTDPSPFFAEAHAREARQAALRRMDAETRIELAAAARARARRRAKKRRQAAKLTSAPAP